MRSTGEGDDLLDLGLHSADASGFHSTSLPPSPLSGGGVSGIGGAAVGVCAAVEERRTERRAVWRAGGQVRRANMF